MSYATIRSAIKTAIEAVTGITGGAGVVKDFQPSVFTIKEFEDHFLNEAASLINAWTISRESVAEFQQDGGFRFQIIHSIIVRGYYGLQNKAITETTFQDLIDAISSSIRGSVSIWVEHPEDNAQGVQTELINSELLASYLVHKCEMRFNVEEVAILSS